ncbi:DUF6192 family protein [Streptomyces europaeiscabiei]|uniref:DUF6192 family protein n=1 Tax=Streptomyces europaeiscabiei TaxID=146819 RepID=UPI0038F6055F
MATDFLRRPEIAFKALRDAKAREQVNEAQFEQAGLHAPAHCGPPHRGDRGNRHRRGPRRRRPGSGHRRSPPPRTPHGATGRIRRTPRTGRRSGCATPGPRPCPPTRAREAGGNRRRWCVGWRGCE